MDKNFEKRVKRAIAEVAAIYKKYDIAAGLSIRLPRHNKPPILAKFALWLLMKYGAIIDTLYTDLRRK